MLWQVRDTTSFTERRWPLSALVGAYVDETHALHERRSGTRVCVDIRGEPGPLPLMRYKTSFGNPKVVVAAINRFREMSPPDAKAV
jgi:hypothetical protein